MGWVICLDIPNLANVLDILQQNPLKDAFSKIEVTL